MANKKKNRIVELDPEHLREVDGVVFYLDSVARPCAPHPAPRPAPAAPAAAPSETAPDLPGDAGAPAPVFVCDPVHIGWYPIQIEGPSYPIMAGAVQPGAAQQTVVWTAGGSGSSSYLSSFLSSFSTSFLTSWRTSWLWGSGSYWYRSSGSFGSFRSSGSAVLAGGYGLELI